MATSYEKVYKRFLNCMNDFNLAELDDHSLGEMLKEWLHTAMIRTRTLKNVVCNDEEEVFEIDLSDLDVELLALGMRLAWLDQQLNSTELTLMMIGGKEEKYYSQSAHIKELRDLRESTVLEMNRLHNYHTYTNNSYFDD